MAGYYQSFKATVSSSGGQYPLHFACPDNDRVAKHLTSFGNTYPEKIVYMGQRHTNSYSAFKAYAKENEVS